MKEIPLTQGKVALVDDEDYESLSQFKWYAGKQRHTFYAERKNCEKGKRKRMIMHRVIMKDKLKENFFVDHIDHNGLNNQKSNLRVVTHRENLMNRRDKNLVSSIYSGVSWKKREKKYEVHVYVKGKNKFLGTFNDEIQAAIVYLQAVYGPNYLYE